MRSEFTTPTSDHSDIIKDVITKSKLKGDPPSHTKGREDLRQMYCCGGMYLCTIIHIKVI